MNYGHNLIYNEAPEILPKDIHRKIKRRIASRILSTNKEKWWTIPTAMVEIDTLRDKYTDENDQEKLKFLDDLDQHIQSIQIKYENF